MAGVKYWVWLSSVPGLTARSVQLLLDHFGSPEEVWYADADELRLVDGLEAAQAALLSERSTDAADRVLGACSRLGVRVMTMQDADYPARLRGIYAPPAVLYVRGRLGLIDEEAAVSVVGTRSCTPYGTQAAEKIAFGLARQGALVISGAARGIDSAAHRGALRAGAPTVAVLGGGVDVIYPRENEALYADIAAAGALVSEYPPGTEALRWHFPARNRIISALSVATLVVEADERSGALITANTALEQGREVFAVPGPIDAPASRGCNRLIAEGAGICTDSWDILREYQAQFPHKLSEQRVELPHTVGYQARQERAAERRRAEEEKRRSALPPLDLRTPDHGLTDDQIALLRALKDAPQSADELIDRTEIPARRVSSALTMLEIDGMVAQDEARRFSIQVELTE